jgi:hypothetical protein
MEKKMKFLMMLTFLIPTQFILAMDCKYAGPQTPRDITSKVGTNSSIFNMAPQFKNMNLCNIHFHKNAEHKGPEFSLSSKDKKYGGFKCNQINKLSQTELKTPKKKACQNIRPGDTIEVHWVYTSCNTSPGEGLGSCSSSSCANPQLRVETQVFVLVNNNEELDFNNFDLAPKKVNGKYQAKKIPTGSSPIEFLGSTTGPQYNNKTKCSPLQVDSLPTPSLKYRGGLKTKLARIIVTSP